MDSPSDPVSLRSALLEWREEVGHGNVIAEEERLRPYRRGTFAIPRGVAAVIRPGCREEVAACLRIANRNAAPLYPVSRGRNWGFGSRLPTSPRCVVILDLGRLNRITAFSEESAYIRVQPGVTFAAADAWLREQGSDLMLSGIGGPADASLIGNAVERGEGFGPHGCRLDHTCDPEIVLPTGDVLSAGFGRFDGARLEHLSRFPCGPSLDGMFTQSNLGVVTEMTFWLVRRPQVLDSFHWQVSGVAALAPVIDQHRDLIRDGVLDPHCSGAWNSYKFFMKHWRYPWKRTGGETPLSAAHHPGLEAWMGNGFLYGPEALREARARCLKAALEPVAARFELKRGNGENASFQNGLAQGVPDDSNLKSVYWRKKGSLLAPLDPDRDRCGVIWLCPTLPFAGKAVVAAVQSICDTVFRHELEPNLGLNFVSSRSMHLFILLVYDREVEGEDERAMACHDQLLTDLMEAGYYPNRLGVQSMSVMGRASGEYRQFYGRIKAALDPNGILAPGHYDAAE